MEIFLDKRSVRQIRQSATDAIEDGDTETLREDVMDAFSEEQIEEIERRIDGGDFYDLMGETLDDWDGDDVDQLFELLAAHLGEVGIELKFKEPVPGEDEEVEEVEEDAESDDDDGDDDPLELDETEDEV
jgi:hypothetical protein